LNHLNIVRTLKCPECGGEMRREDRPGEGANVDEKAEAESVKERR